MLPPPPHPLFPSFPAKNIQKQFKQSFQNSTTNNWQSNSLSHFSSCITFISFWNSRLLWFWIILSLGFWFNLDPLVLLPRSYLSTLQLYLQWSHLYHHYILNSSRPNPNLVWVQAQQGKSTKQDFNLKKNASYTAVLSVWVFPLLVHCGLHFSLTKTLTNTALDGLPPQSWAMIFKIKLCLSL